MLSTQSNGATEPTRPATATVLRHWQCTRGTLARLEYSAGGQLFSTLVDFEDRYVAFVADAPEKVVADAIEEVAFQCLLAGSDDPSPSGVEWMGFETERQMRASRCLVCLTPTPHIELSTEGECTRCFVAHVAQAISQAEAVL